MLNPSRRIGEFLVERKVLSRDAMEAALGKEAAEGRPLAAILVADGMVGEKDLVAAIAASVGKRFVDLGNIVVSPELDRLVPPEVATRHLAVAIEFEGNDVVVAMADPNDRDAVTAIEAVVPFPVRPALAVRGELQRLVSAMYGTTMAPTPVDDLALEISLGEERSSARPSAAWADVEVGEELHINELLQRVLDLGGSDLHLTTGIEPTVRAHGELKRLTEFPVLNGS